MGSSGDSLLKATVVSPLEAGIYEHLGRAVLDDIAKHTFLVVRLPLEDAATLVELLAKCLLAHLPGDDLYELSRRLLSLFDFKFTPTSIPRLPIRVDVLLRRICDQSLQFVPNLLARVTEWFGFVPEKALRAAWLDSVRGCRQGVVLPEPLQLFQERGLAAVIEREVLIPLTVLGAWRVQSRLPSWDALADLLRQARDALMESGAPGGLRERHYGLVTGFLQDPNPTLEGHLHRSTRARGELVDLTKVEWHRDVSTPVIEALLVALQALFDFDHNRYQQTFNRVHGRVWEHTYRATRDVAEIAHSVEQRPLVADSSDWVASCRMASHALTPIARGYTLLTNLEETLGVDRYLGSRVVASDLDRVHALVRNISSKSQVALADLQRLFLQEWNLTQLAPTVLSLLGIQMPASRLGAYFPANQQRVIFLLVDALGYTQFHWFLQTVARRAYTPLAGNIFAWLQERQDFNDTFMLASNLVGVTGGCLPTIYTGTLPRDTGLIGSHILIEGRVLNVLRGTDHSPGKRLSPKEVSDLYQRNVNLGAVSLTELAQRESVDVRVFHGGTASFRPFAEYTYGQLAKDSSRFHVISEADRTFSDTMAVFENLSRERVRRQLVLIYYPLLDHSGHHCGPYTQFQATELSKLNFLFTHFLVELLERCGAFFDGRTSVVISADHGMFESSSKVVSERMIRRAAKGVLPEDAVIIYDNRACYIYGVPPGELENVRQALGHFFEAQDFAVAVSTKEDEVVRKLLYDPGARYASNCPDLVLQFWGPGIFYQKESLAPHMFLYGAHGGCSVEETFVPLIHFVLTEELGSELRRFYR